MAGISRSATLVVAYLIKKYNYSMDSILSLLKRKRSIVIFKISFRLTQIKASYSNLNFLKTKISHHKINFSPKEQP